jgi:DNA repair protein RadA/Sms
MQFVCQNCGYVSLKWLGKCPSCGEWNTFIEEKISKKKEEKEFKKPIPLSLQKKEGDIRIKIDFSEIDRVFGDGLVKGGYYLLGGEPGIGKSTLLLQIGNILAEKGYKVLYISGEESPSQIKMRAERLNINSENIFLMCENNIEGIKEGIKEIKPDIVIIDSIQTIYSQDFASSCGSITQIRECGGELLRLTKENEMITFVIGHVTKTGEIAGPKALEHMVDAVFYLESDETGNFRILRSVKNRFGNVNEIGIFEMTDKGLKEVKEIEMFFLNKNFETPGSAVVSTVQGSRIVFVEVQALVTKTFFPLPKREAGGFDIRRLSLLIAVMEKRLNIPFYKYDVYLNVTGGIKIFETSADLGVCVSLISSMKNIKISKENLFIGEVGLGGEIRPVNLINLRLKEAQKKGFKKCFIPNQEVDSLNVEIFKIKKIEEIMEILK